MALSVADFRIDYPQFTNDETYPDAVIERYLDRAAAQMDEAAWRDLFDDGQGALAAHNLSIAYGGVTGGGSVRGSLSRIDVPGEIVLAYSDISTSSGGVSDLTSTAYGLKYLRLQRIAAVTTVRFY